MVASYGFNLVRILFVGEHDVFVSGRGGRRLMFNCVGTLNRTFHLAQENPSQR